MYTKRRIKSSLQPIAHHVLILLIGLLTSCASVGPDKMVSTHVAYNESAQLTTAREVLLNVVRARYSDPTSFLKIEAINAQFSISESARAGVGGIGSEIAATVTYSDSPTITYTPQSDAAFYKSMSNPLEIEDVFDLMHLGSHMAGIPGWQNRMLRFMFSSINGEADVRDGKRNEAYTKRIKALTQLADNGAFLQQTAEWHYQGDSFEKDQVSAEDRVIAFDRGLYFINEEGGDRVRMALFQLVATLIIPDPSDPVVIEALNKLGVQPGRKQYIFRPPSHLVPGKNDPFAIWVTPRSLADILIISGQFVSVPVAHTGIVRSYHETIDIPVQILNSDKEPESPYRVQHRGYWFYLNDSNTTSRAFLEFLVGLYQSRVGSRQALGAAPQLVLPIGGN